MKLNNILNGMNYKKLNASLKEAGDISLSSVHYDSRIAGENSLFVAVKGLVSDGHDYIEKAVNNGAKVVVAEKEVETDATLIVVDDSRRALSQIADIFYGNPSRELTVIGLTGTNGKTTITYMIESILEKAGIKCGVIGTVNYRYCGNIFPNPRTTPESLDLHRIMAEMKKNSVTHVVMEVSSHAIDLKRVDDVSFDITLFTNLTQDHLDYHKDMESYWKIKRKLFTEIQDRSGKKRLAVINTVPEKGKELFSELEKRETDVVSTGLDKSSMIYASDLKMDISGIHCRIDFPESNFELKSDAVGKHNVENLLCAAGVGYKLGILPSDIKKGLENFAVPGRLERAVQGKNVFVDYAHTPDALENVLSTLKNAGNGRLITVFGCGGDRDKTKRPVMGEIAGRYSDISIVTSDNPRTEDPHMIISEILTAFKSDEYEEIWELTRTDYGKRVFHVEADRKKAIEKAIGAAGTEDIVIIAGKGHETYQEIGKERFPFNDSSVAKGVLI